MMDQVTIPSILCWHFFPPSPQFPFLNHLYLVESNRFMPLVFALNPIASCHLYSQALADQQSDKVRLHQPLVCNAVAFLDALSCCCPVRPIPDL